MADKNKKLYYPEVKPGDIQTIHPDGGGVILKEEYKAFLGPTKDEEISKLTTENYKGLINVLPNTVTGLWVFSSNSSPLQNNITLGNDNKISIITPDPITTATEPNPDCGGVYDDNKEWLEISKNMALWEDLNSSGIVDDSGKFFKDNVKGLVKSEDQLKRLGFKQDIIEVIKKYNTLDNSVWKNLGWGRYGRTNQVINGKKAIDSFNIAIGDMFLSYWVSPDPIARESTNPSSDNNPSFNRQFKDNSTVPGQEQISNLSIFLPSVLPSGLRSMCLRASYNSGKTWVRRLLTTVGPDRLALKDSNGKILGITILESRNISDKDVKQGKPGSTDNQINQKFNQQYDDIINYYNTSNDDKKKEFLTTFATENKEWYKRYVKQGSDSRFVSNPSEFNTFYNTYVDIALSTAMKYVNCPNEYELVTTTSKPINPTNTPSGTDDNIVIEAQNAGVSSNNSDVFYSYGPNGEILKSFDKDGNLIKDFYPNGFTEQPMPTTNAEATEGSLITYNNDDEGIIDIDLDSLPSREIDIDPALYENVDEISSETGINRPSQVNVEGITYVDISGEVKMTKEPTKTTQFQLGSNGGAGSGINAVIYIIKSGGKITDDSTISAVLSAKNGASNVIETAFRFNPENVDIINSSIPKFKAASKAKSLADIPILAAMHQKLGPYTGLNGTSALFCGEGVSFSFLTYNSSENDLRDKKSNTGGFPATVSSWIVPAKQFTGNKTQFIYGTDFGPSGLTSSGITKWNIITQYKGAVFTVGSSWEGHAGLIYYLDKRPNKGYAMYTLEFNVSRTCKILRRVIGCDWNRSYHNRTDIWIGETSTFGGGAWAPNGLASDYTIAGIGSVKNYIENKYP